MEKQQNEALFESFSEEHIEDDTVPEELIEL